jgi:hypothetical protein
MDLTSSWVKAPPTNRIHSAKSSHNTSGIFPAKEVEAITNQLVDMRKESGFVREQLRDVKYHSLRLIAKVTKAFGVPSSNQDIIDIADSPKLDTTKHSVNTAAVGSSDQKGRKSPSVNTSHICSGRERSLLMN